MKVYIVYGGPSSENSVSQQSKVLFAKLLDKYSPLLVEWKKEGTFRLDNEELSLPNFLTRIKETQGIFINAMHGEFCEDGWIQEKLESSGVTFSGPSGYAAKLSMDKIASQKLVSDIVKTIPTMTLTVSDEGDVNAVEYDAVKNSNWKYPLFLKPNAKGSSVGVYKVKDHQELDELVKSLAPDKYLVQPEICGREISIGTVCDQGKYLDLSPTEIIPNSEFFDYNAKYAASGSQEITPARISSELMQRVKESSIAIHERLKLGCYSRTDMILVGNDIYYLETNSLPGMTEKSLLPQQLKKINILNQFGDILLRNLNVPL